jgi:phosphoribosylformylglycinamidine cyclo-ligase
MIAISKSFGVEAQIIGFVEGHSGKKLTIEGAWGSLEY